MLAFSSVQPHRAADSINHNLTLFLWADDDRNTSRCEHLSLLYEVFMLTCCRSTVTWLVSDSGLCNRTQYDHFFYDWPTNKFTVIHSQWSCEFCWNELISGWTSESLHVTHILSSWDRVNVDLGPADVLKMKISQHEAAVSDGHTESPRVYWSLWRLNPSSCPVRNRRKHSVNLIC